MNKKVFLYLVFLCIGAQLYGQKQIFKGQVIDFETKEPIPYATLLIQNTIYGVQANEQGYYTLELPAGYEKDSISVKSLSYIEKVFAISQMKKQQTIALKLNSLLLDEVIVYPIDPEEILKLAVENQDKNHKAKQSKVQQCFSRELFFDKGKCFRVGESIVDIYTLKLPDSTVLRNAKKMVAARAIQDSAKLWFLNDVFRFKHDTISLDENFNKNILGFNIISLFGDSDKKTAKKETSKPTKKKEERKET